MKFNELGEIKPSKKTKPVVKTSNDVKPKSEKKAIRESHTASQTSQIASAITSPQKKWGFDPLSSDYEEYLKETSDEEYTNYKRNFWK
jgi:hypothetical protein